MTFRGTRIYHVIILDFWKGKYMIYEYQKDRRYTPRQKLNLLNHPSFEPIIIGDLKANDTIYKYSNLIKEFGYNSKYCDLQIRYSPTN